MTVVCDKVVYVVHLRQLDDDGNPIGELSTEKPLTLYAHQLDDLPKQVQAIVVQANSQNGRVEQKA